MFVDSVEIMLQNVLKEQFCLVLNHFVYVGDVSGDTLPDDGRSIFRNVANINKLVQDKTKLFFQNILQQEFYVLLQCRNCSEAFAV